MLIKIKTILSAVKTFQFYLNPISKPAAGLKEVKLNACHGKTKINILILTGIVLMAFSLRSCSLSSLPALNPDEAALGYNAYSLLQTGQDEHGAAWPLHFKSFGDYKPGGYVYLALPFIKLLGLTPLAIRLPNLILSVLTVYFLYLLVRLITKNQNLALLSALVLAISPWHIHFSRGAWESNTALAFITIGTYFFFKYVTAKRPAAQNLLLFTVFYALSLYVYHSARIVAPVLALALLVIYFQTLKDNLRHLIPVLIIGLAISLPVAFSFLRSGGTARFGGVGLTADQGPVWRANELLNHHGSPDLKYRLFHNKKVLYLLSWGQKYSSHFDFNFLFITGDEVPRSKSPDMGQLHLIELPLLLIGLIAFLKSKLLTHKSKVFIFAWLLAAPLASSLTFQAPSALRALPLVIPLSILVGFGLYSVLVFIHRSPFVNRKFIKLAVFGLFTVFYLFSVVYFLDAYYIHAPKRYPFAWNTGFKELSDYLKTQSGYDRIYITTKYDQPYILMLFFDRMDPKTVQSQIKLTPPDQFGFSTVAQLGPYVFGPINWDNIPTGSLVVAADETVPAPVTHTINFPNGSPGFRIFSK